MGHQREIFYHFAKPENIVALNLFKIHALPLIGATQGLYLVGLQERKHFFDLILFEGGTKQFGLFVDVDHHLEIFVGKKDLRQGDFLSENRLLFDGLNRTEAVKWMTNGAIAAKFTQINLNSHFQDLMISGLSNSGTGRKFRSKLYFGFLEEAHVLEKGAEKSWRRPNQDLSPSVHSACDSGVRGLKERLLGFQSP